MNKEKKPKKLRVLTVDDSQIIADRLRYMLASILGVDLLGNAYNVSAALYLIQQEKPHVIIMDINLSDRSTSSNGMNLLLIVKDKYPEIKVIMLTNRSDTMYRELCLEMGADHFFDKSNDFKNISDIIKQYRNEICLTDVN